LAAALSEQITACGPIVDAAAARLTAETLREAARADGWRDLLEAAWPALAPVFAASPYLTTLARRSPDDLRAVLAAEPGALCRRIIAAAEGLSRRATAASVEHRLRRLKARLHLLIAVADLGGVFDLAAATGFLSRFADAALGAATAVAAREAFGAGQITRQGEGWEGPLPGLFCLAMGKLGAFELNFSSDIDISVFYEPGALPLAPSTEAAAFATRFTERIADLLRRRTVDGYVFRVDLRLRPDPASTPAAVSIPAAIEYYQSVGQNWERAAFIKARAAAGDIALAKSFLGELEPFIWRRSLDFAAIADIHSITRQIQSRNPHDTLTAAGADLKLGRGGIREIEFYVQTQQLILGGRRPELRDRSTLGALYALGAGGHAPQPVADALAQSYRDLRRLEHRVQMVGDEQTHRLPKADDDRRRVAALSGARTLGQFDRAVGSLLKGVHRRCRELFAGEEPLFSRFGSLIFTGVEDDSETLATLGRMGFSDPAKVTGEIRGWHHGHIAASRSEQGREALTRLAPRLLEAAEATGAPDVAFARFSDFFVGLNSGVQVQLLLLAKPKLLELVVRIMALAPRFAGELARRPTILDALLDPAFFSPLGDKRAIADAIGASESFEEAMDVARRLHREATFKIAAQVLERVATADAAGRAFADLADAVIRGLAAASLGEVERIAGALAGDVAVVALGKCGSAEMTATSDLDLMTLYQGADGAVSREKLWSPETFFARFTHRLVAALSAPTAEGGLYAVDLQLRPSGTKGPVAVSLPAFESYYASEAEVWELLALTRARVVWATSDGFRLAAQQAIETALRRPREARTTAVEVAAMRELMRQERPPGGFWDMKLSDGGLVDIEFCAQFLQLIHAPTGGPLRQNTLEALGALEAAGAAPAQTLQPLAGAFRLQQNLSQLMKVALPEGADPSTEPKGLRSLMALAAETARFSGVRKNVNAARDAATAAFGRLLATQA
jgi:glutamate-ammonia-ligase adenylyltransferase